MLYVKERYSREKRKTEVHRIGPKHSARLATLDHTKGLYKEMTDTPVQLATVAKEAGQIQRDVFQIFTIQNCVILATREENSQGRGAKVTFT